MYITYRVNSLSRELSDSPNNPTQPRTITTTISTDSTAPASAAAVGED